MKNLSDLVEWQKILLETEKIENLETITGVYDKFFECFPLCYVYWTKYAKKVQQLGTPEGAEAVYERAIDAVGTSAELWKSYIEFVDQQYQNEEKTKASIERALARIGVSWTSSLIWDKYIEFSSSKEYMGKVLFRAIEVPTAKVDEYFEKFKNLYETMNPKDCVDEEAYQKIVSENSSDEAAIREAVLKLVTEAHSVSSAKANSRRKYEETIATRDYFHTPAVSSELQQTWRDYLEFMEKEGSAEETAFLYERCVVVNCLYPEFWLRFANWGKQHGRADAAKRAVSSCILNKRSWAHEFIIGVIENAVKENPESVEGRVASIAEAGRQNNFKALAQLVNDGCEVHRNSVSALSCIVVEGIKSAVKCTPSDDVWWGKWISAVSSSSAAWIALADAATTISKKWMTESNVEVKHVEEEAKPAETTEKPSEAQTENEAQKEDEAGKEKETASAVPANATSRFAPLPPFGSELCPVCEVFEHSLGYKTDICGTLSKEDKLLVTEKYLMHLLEEHPLSTRYFELQQVRRKLLQATTTTTTASEQPQAKRQCLYSPYQQNTAYSPYATYQRYSQQIPYQQYQMYQQYQYYTPN